MKSREVIKKEMKNYKRKKRNILERKEEDKWKSPI